VKKLTALCAAVVSAFLFFSVIGCGSAPTESKPVAPPKEQAEQFRKQRLEEMQKAKASSKSTPAPPAPGK